ncbi:MAG: S41 family peptidase [Saccharofermentanales bacterium]
MSEDNENNQETEKSMDLALRKRTFITVLICIPTVIILTVAILFYTIYIPLMKDQADNSLLFDENKETVTAVSKLKMIIKELKDNYLVTLTDKQIIDAMTSGLPGSLNNPYTYYLSADEYSRNQESMSGNYVGIGCTVTHSAQGETIVVDVIEGGPAEEAGLKAGDMFVSVDGVNVQQTKAPEDVAAKVKGKEGTTVKIVIYRKSAGKNITMPIIRKTIKSQNVKYRMLDKTTGYMMIKGFTNDVDIDFIKAMDDLQIKGAKNVVFDLRYNPGGSANSMIGMLEYLLPKGTLLASIKGRSEGKPFEENWVTKEKMSVPGTMKYAILVNEYSASASEFFSGCLRDHGKAVLIGKNTFGKGSGTSLFVLPDGSAVNITTFKYYLPKGESIEGKGLKPDIEIDIAEKDKTIPIEQLTIEQDAPLKKAIEILNK